MDRRLKRGDMVEVTTINRGGPPLESRAREKKETWSGEIVGPSLLGRDWWIVRRLGSAMPGRTYTVPSDEIELCVRK